VDVDERRGQRGWILAGLLDVVLVEEEVAEEVRQIEELFPCGDVSSFFSISWCLP